jgi:hypothetical protein
MHCNHSIPFTLDSYVYILLGEGIWVLLWWDLHFSRIRLIHRTLTLAGKFMNQTNLHRKVGNSLRKHQNARWWLVYDWHHQVKWYTFHHINLHLRLKLKVIISIAWQLVQLMHGFLKALAGIVQHFLKIWNRLLSILSAAFVTCNCCAHYSVQFLGLTLWSIVEVKLSV